MSHVLLRGALMASAFVLMTQAALAQDKAAQDKAAEDPVVARVNGEEVLRSEVEESAKQLPPQYQAQLEAMFPMLLQRTIDLKLLGAAAAAAEMEKDPDVVKRMAEIKADVIRSVYLEKQVSAKISDDDLKKSYADFLKANPPEPEVHARHILVKEETEAKDLIKKLDGGADFAALAKEHSIGPSGAQGGDLSYFTKDQMVPAFAEAAFAMEKDAHSKAPVQTQFGWHVIQVLDKREVAPPPMEEVEEQLFEELSQKAMQDIVTELRDGAEIEIVGAPEQAGDKKSEKTE